MNTDTNEKKVRPQRRKYHFIYKTVCIVTGRFYIGMHSTNNIEDGYLGSGKRLGYSIKKYGEESHKREILYWCNCREELALKEKEIVTEELLKDEMCMNLTTGGSGSFHAANNFFNIDILNKRKKQLREASKIHLDKIKNDKVYCDIVSSKIQKTIKAKIEVMSQEEYAEMKRKQREHGKHAFLGKHHTEEFKKKIGKVLSESNKGNGNPNYGKVWIYSLIEKRSISVKKEELEIWLKKGWIKGRKFNFYLT